MHREREEGAELPSNRSFGFLFAVVLGLLSAYFWWRSSAAFIYLLGFAALFGLVTLVHADLLAPLNAAWMRLAELLHRIVSPVVLGVMFFVVITPFALVMRAAGRDIMRRRFEPHSSSYWLARQPPGPPPESLRDQF